MKNGAGQRNRKVAVMRMPGTESAWGQPQVKDRVKVTDIWVRIWAQSGAASIRSGQEAAIARTALRGNYRTDIRETDELWMGATRYRIAVVLPDEINREHTDYVCEVINGTSPAQ